MGIPLFLDHFEKVPVVDDSLKDRPQGEPVMSTKRCREAKDRDGVLGGIRLFLSVRMKDCRMETRQDAPVPAYVNRSPHKV